MYKLFHFSYIYTEMYYIHSKIPMWVLIYKHLKIGLMLCINVFSSWIITLFI